MNAIVLLAAGTSSRLGEPKQLLDFDGEPLVRRIAKRLLEVDRGKVAVVLGASGTEVLAALDGVGVLRIGNAYFTRGIGTSVRAAARYAEYSNADSLLIALCDQPEIGVAHFRALVDSLGDADATATDYAGKGGVPAVFSRRLFARLMTLSDTAGAAKILRDRKVKTRLLACPEAAIDLDTPAAVEEWRRVYRGKSA